jgi:hypothetical protein
MVWAVSLSTTQLIPRCLTACSIRTLRSLIRFGKRLAPEPIQRSTRTDDQQTLHLNAFRGEPAISEFVWHFTSTHSSSNRFATRDSSGLHVPLRTLHPGHG